MPLFRLRVNVRTNGKLRNLLFVEEKPKGDVYIRLKSGFNVGIPPNEISVVQDRYSVHPSPGSPSYVTLKSTLELANGFKRTAVALTDAVKLKNGFAHLFTHLATDLSDPFFDAQDDGAYTIELGDFNPSQDVLVLGVFVGHPETFFPATSNTEVTSSFCSKHFKFVVCTLLVNLPASPYGETMTSLTFPPEVYDHDAGIESAYRKMVGDSPATCLELFHGLVGELTVNLLRTYQSLASDTETKARIQETIDSVPRMASITI